MRGENDTAYIRYVFVCLQVEGEKNRKKYENKNASRDTLVTCCVVGVARIRLTRTHARLRRGAYTTTYRNSTTLRGRFRRAQRICSLPVRRNTIGRLPGEQNRRKVAISIREKRHVKSSNGILQAAESVGNRPHALAREPFF